MTIQHFSHMAIGVRDMDVALPFWRDVVGLHVSLDTVEAMPRGDGKAPARRRAVYMRWNDDPRFSFVVLDQQLDFDTPGEPAQIFQMGLHHYGFWVDDVDPILARVEDAGVKVLLDGSVGADSVWWGEPPGDTIRSVIVQDPEGGYVQFDQRV
jgi:catechol 2,3-dioxygenase-like lactoylglutathione lyase family enzyme